MGILEITPILWTRRNHALEHATIHILSRLRPYTNMAGRSMPGGFIIYGRLPTETVTQAVTEAIRRLQSGEHSLAIHPNCGTNLVTTAALAAGGTMLANIGRRQHTVERVPASILGALAGVYVSQRVGNDLQRLVTTCADIGEVEVVDIERKDVGKRTLHRINLRYTSLD